LDAITCKRYLSPGTAYPFLGCIHPFLIVCIKNRFIR
jgi:hypothetical protein